MFYSRFGTYILEDDDPFIKKLLIITHTPGANQVLNIFIFSGLYRVPFSKNRGGGYYLERHPIRLINAS